MKELQLSLFKGYPDTVPDTITLQGIINLIQNDPSVRDHTEKYRYYHEQGSLSAAAREKSSCPCFAVAVTFAGGKQQAHIQSWTSLGIVDIDNVPTEKLPEIRKQITGSPHTLLCYTTISGRGIRIIFPIEGLTDDTEQNIKPYKKAFEQGNRYYADLTGCTCDLKCKNATRLSGLAHDTDVYFNPDATPFHITIPQKRTPGNAKPAGKRLLKKALTAAGRILKKEGITYEAHHRNEYIMRMGYLLNTYGIPLQETEEWAARQFADYNGDAAGIIRSCYRHTDEHNTRPLTGNGSAPSEEEGYANVAEIEKFLASQALFRQNIITRQCEVAFKTLNDISGKPAYTSLTDRDVNTLWSRMNKEISRVRLNDIYNVLHSEYVLQFNPFREFLFNLKPWDGITDYIGELADTVRVKGDQQRFKHYFRKWFVNILPTLFEEHSVNHEILVLIGPQGSYKTTWFNHLLPPELQRYFYTKMNSGRITKDDQFTLTEFVLICLEEIDEMRPAELSQLKALVTMKGINERAAYGRNKEHRTHIASFCGTGNNIQFLNDPTGNRRWLPFEVEEIKDPNLYPFNYEGIYSQAFALWKSGFRYWFNREEIDVLNEHNRNFETPNLEKELILTHFRRPLPGENGIFITTAHILNRINALIKHPLSSTKIGIIMKQLGFENIRCGGQRGYRAVEYNAEEIYRNQCAAARYGSDSSTVAEQL